MVYCHFPNQYSNEKEDAWFNYQTYFDAMDKDAVGEFIRVTHERYNEVIGDRFGKSVLVSLMRQYTPMPGMKPPFDRPITPEEYDSVLSWMFLNDLNGFTQEETAAQKTYIPDF